MRGPWFLNLGWTASVLALIALVAACNRKLSPETPCGFQVNSELQRISWNVKLPVRLYVHNSAPLAESPEIEADLRAAAEAWNRVIGKEVIRIEGFGVSGSKTPARDGYSLIYWMDQWEPGRGQEQARTTVYWTGSQIQEADIRINTAFRLAYSGGIKPHLLDFKSLMIHEFGHVLGLAHSAVPASVMQKELANGVQRATISLEDQVNVRCEY